MINSVQQNYEKQNSLSFGSVFIKFPNKPGESINASVAVRQATTAENPYELVNKMDGKSYKVWEMKGKNGNFDDNKVAKTLIEQKLDAWV